MCGWESKKQVNRLQAATGEPRQLLGTGRRCFYTENTVVFIAEVDSRTDPKRCCCPNTYNGVNCKRELGTKRRGASRALTGSDHCNCGESEIKGEDGMMESRLEG